MALSPVSFDRLHEHPIFVYGWRLSTFDWPDVDT